MQERIVSVVFLCAIIAHLTLEQWVWFSYQMPVLVQCWHGWLCQPAELYETLIEYVYFIGKWGKPLT